MHPPITGDSSGNNASFAVTIGVKMGMPWVYVGMGIISSVIFSSNKRVLWTNKNELTCVFISLTFLIFDTAFLAVIPTQISDIKW